MDNVEYLQSRCVEAVRSIPVECRDALIDAILESKRIFVYGSGRSGLIGQLFAVRLVQLGLEVYFVGDMTTPIIGKGDLTILVSNTGVTVSVVKTADIARRIGSNVIAITTESTSKLAHASNLVIPLKITPAPKSSELTPLGTVFEDSVLLFFDSIVPDLMKKRGVAEIDMRKKHAIWV